MQLLFPIPLDIIISLITQYFLLLLLFHELSHKQIVAINLVAVTFDLVLSTLSELRTLFVRTIKSNEKHFGLGLAIVAERTQYYGGTLKLVSDESNGTVFQISIPQKEVVAG